MDLSRRRFLKLCALHAAAAALPRWPLFALPGRRDVLTKPIPATGQALPVIGMGTWRTFDVGNDRVLREKRVEVLKEFFNGGGGMIDSSPMYGSSEATIGYGLNRLGHPAALFSATKVWTTFAAHGVEQIRESHELWGLKRFDLFQVHNLRSWPEHLKTLLAMKREGKLKYVGVTTSHGRRHDELEQVMRAQPLDFVQLTYNMRDRAVEDRLLPLAQDRGIAVIANRPYDGGNLIDFVKERSFPSWAKDFGCRTWPEVVLKWVVSHPAVTCAIPATSRVDHMRENMAACEGPLPDAAERRRLLDYVTGL
jgi:diketogulonate reductase-like aldo/keto reductase